MHHNCQRQSSCVVSVDVLTCLRRNISTAPLHCIACYRADLSKSLKYSLDGTMHGALNDEDKVKDCQEDDDVSNDGDDRLTRMLNMEVTRISCAQFIQGDDQSSLLQTTIHCSGQMSPR